jgi:hypothetical protein
MKKLFDLFSKKEKFEIPIEGREIKITWLPDNHGESNAYIGMQGIVEGLEKNGIFHLIGKNSVLTIGVKRGKKIAEYKFEYV